jgi:hypothetical protein
LPVNLRLLTLVDPKGRTLHRPRGSVVLLDDRDVDDARSRTMNHAHQVHNTTAARCDRIIELIDTCLTDYEGARASAQRPGDETLLSQWPARTTPIGARSSV